MTAKARRLGEASVLLLDFYGTLADAPSFDYEERIAILLGVLGRRLEGLDPERFEEVYREAVDEHRELMRELREVHNSRWVASALERLGYETGPESAEVTEAVDAYFDRYVREIEPYGEVDEALRGLGKCYRMGVVSNFTDPRPVRETIRRLGWEPLFETIVVSSEVGWRKPHAEIFRAGLEGMGIGPEEAIYVGDHPLADVEGARRAGMATVRVARPDLPPDWFYPWGPETEFEEADLVVADLAELAEGLLGCRDEDEEE